VGNGYNREKVRAYPNNGSRAEPTMFADETPSRRPKCIEIHWSWDECVAVRTRSAQAGRLSG